MELGYGLNFVMIEELREISETVLKDYGYLPFMEISQFFKNPYLYLKGNKLRDILSQ
jgi:hypothetical protein